MNLYPDPIPTRLGNVSPRINFPTTSTTSFLPRSKMAPLYPPFPTNNSGHLKVSDVHDIYYEECGLQTGVPIVYLHGGPGGGIEDSDR